MPMKSSGFYKFAHIIKPPCMKTLLIEEEQQSAALRFLPSHETLFTNQHNSIVERIVDEVRSKYADYDLIVFNAVVGADTRAGIRLLKLLRLHHVDCHIILYSSREIDLKPWDYALLHSEGVSFFVPEEQKPKPRLFSKRPQVTYYTPEVLKQMTEADFASLSEKKSDPEQLKYIFRMEYEPNSRHFNANLFGVWQLVKAQKIYEQRREQKDTIEQDFADEAYSIEHSMDNLLAQYVSDYDFELNEEQYCAALSERNHTELERALEQFRAHPPKIIYVDDLADKGWSHILQRIIYGGTSDCFVTIVPKHTEQPQEIMQRILDAKKQLDKPIDKTSLIMLDIRLKNEHSDIDPDKLSGFLVMDLLNRQHLQCPIMMLTASNKIWSLQKAFKGNALSFWIKGNVENRGEAIARSYFSLIEQIHSLVEISWIFDILAQMRATASRIGDAKPDSFWWETYKRGYTIYDNSGKREEFTRKLTNRDDIVRLLERAAEVTLNSLRQTYFRNDIFNPSDLYGIMIVQMSYILEEIHRNNEVADDEIDSQALKYRMSFHLSTEYKEQIETFCSLRNLAAHQGNTSINKEQVIEFSTKLIEFITRSKIDAFTPIPNRRNKLQNGEAIDVEIVTVIKGQDTIKNWVELYFRLDASTQKYAKAYDDWQPYYNDYKGVKQGDIVRIRGDQVGGISYKLLNYFNSSYR